MGTAKKLYEELKKWMPKRKKTATELIQLSNELNRIHHECQVAKVATTSVAVAGSLSVVGAGILTVLTAGLATPALVMAVGGTAAAVGGSVASGITSLVENLQSSSKMDAANNIISEDAKSGNKINELWKKLQEDCKINKDCQNKENAASAMLLDAISTANGLNIPIETQIGIFYGVAGIGIIEYTIGPTIIQGLSKGIAMIGMKAAISAAAKIGGGFLGLALSAPELVTSSMELAKGEPTAASTALKEASKTIEDAVNELADNLEKIEKIFKQMARIKQIVKALKYASYATDEGMQVINFVRERCTNAQVLKWLENAQNVPVFLNNVSRFYKQLEEELNKDSSRDQDGHINIALISHGRISLEFVPAAVMMPLATIKDVIVYSPWNCFIDYKAGYMIAAGSMDIENRLFMNYHDSRRPPHVPVGIPNWNRLSERITSEIPLHWVRPISHSEEAWSLFSSLEQRNLLSKLPNWLVLPYLLPSNALAVNFPEVPLFVITWALSVVLWFSGRRATFHLAACAAYSHSDARLVTDYHRQLCAGQYAYAYDETFMSNSLLSDSLNDEIKKAFRSLFDDPN